MMTCDLLKLFPDIHYHYHSKIEVSEEREDANWFDKVDQIIFTFKYLVHYIQYNDEICSRKYLK